MTNQPLELRIPPFDAEEIDDLMDTIKERVNDKLAAKESRSGYFLEIANIVHRRSSVTSHTLALESLRHHLPLIARQHRKCRLCQLREVKTPEHVLLLDRSLNRDRAL